MPTNDLVVDRQYLQHLMERMQGEYVATSFIRQSATAVSLPKSGTRTQYQYNLGYSVIRVHREPKYGRAYIADDERFLYVSGFWLLGFGAVKMSRVTKWDMYNARYGRPARLSRTVFRLPNTR